MGPHRAAGRGDSGRAVRDRRERALADVRRVPRRVQPGAAGLAALGVGEGTNVSWQLPTWLESMVLVGALARLGAVQNPMLPIYREREVGFITNQTGAKLLIVPSVWRASTTRRWRARSRRARPASRSSSATRTCPTATRRRSARPRPARRRAVQARRGDRRPVALGLLHVGHHRRPEGCAPHRQDGRRVGVHDGPRARDDAGGPQRDGVPVHAHRRDRLAVRRAHGRLRPRARRVVRPGHDHPGARARAGDDRRRGHRVPPRVPHRAARRSPGAGSSRRSARSSAVARRSRRRCTSR